MSLAFLLARLKEPSTFAGAGALFAAFGIHASDPVLQLAIQAITSLAGLAAIFLPEKAGQS
jgi:hypothetical protein